MHDWTSNNTSSATLARQHSTLLAPPLESRQSTQQQKHDFCLASRFPRSSMRGASVGSFIFSQGSRTAAAHLIAHSFKLQSLGWRPGFSRGSLHTLQQSWLPDQPVHSLQLLRLRYVTRRHIVVVRILCKARWHLERSF